MANVHKVIGYKWMQGGNVPGGHNLPYDGFREPFITPMAECNSIPLRHSDVVVDIGAYVGTYAIRCARIPVKSVTAYEPTPMTFDILSQTQLPNLKLVNAAIVGDNRNSVDLYLSAGIGVTNSIVLSNRKESKVTVPAINYANAVRGASIVKIDVEGAEYSYPIVQPGLRAIILDFHKVAGHDWIGRSKELIASFEKAGFKSVIEPNFESGSGWTLAGSWIREVETSGEFEPMMKGEICCGCATKINAKKKSLCPKCYGVWLPKHREGYELAGM